MNKKELIEHLTNVLGTLSNMVLNQIDKYAKTGITYKEIARAVSFLYEVQNKDKKDVATYGIGLVPHVLAQANAYYDDLRQKIEDQRAQIENAESINSREVSPQDRIKRDRKIDINEL